MKRRRSGDAEREQQQRQSDEKPRTAVEACVDRAFERARPRPSALGCGRGGRHGLQSRPGFGRAVFPWKRSWLGLQTGGVRAKPRSKRRRLVQESLGAILVEIGGFRFRKLW